MNNYHKLLHDFIKAISIIRGKDAFTDIISNTILCQEYVDYEWVVKMIESYFGSTYLYFADNFEPNKIERLTHFTVCRYVTLFWQLKQLENEN